MKFEQLHIQNFRAHSDTRLPLSDFGCLIGENNAGKSSVLHALHFALKGAPPSKLDVADFNDIKTPIRVEVTLRDIGADDLARISDEGNRASVANVVKDGRLTFARTAALGAKPIMHVMQQVPKAMGWSLVDLNAAMKGKSGSDLRATAVALIPELDFLLAEKPTQGSIREERERLISALPEEDMELREGPPPTGIEAAMRSFLPEVIYIEAVKDAASEMKTSDSATFGKLLKILLDEVADQFGDIEQAFAEVQRKLSRFHTPDGEISDLRLEEVKLIESTIERFVQESFPGVKLRMDVPAPELRTILGSAELQIDDGHLGPIGSKGDGLKRTVAFAILRAYTSLREGGLTSGKQSARPRQCYLLLFEEPELYLHPRAQRQLFDALALFAVDHPVMVTTHSPVFFSAESTSTFIKLQKTPSTSDGPASVRPFPVDFRGQLSARDAFQLVCHENNEAALFARTVVLVEGDSDVVVFPHLAKLLDSAWDNVEQNIVFIRTGGKTSIGRYRDFFGHFDIDVHAIADLDALVEGFKNLSEDANLKSQRDELMAQVSRRLVPTSIPGRKLRDVVSRGDVRGLWQDAQVAFNAWSACPSAETAAVVEERMTGLFEWPRGGEKLLALQSGDSSIDKHLDTVLEGLRAQQVHVLRRGDRSHTTEENMAWGTRFEER
ncbi:ATP-dependent endonuclease [Cryobacterium sp. TMB1-7]|uniref:ATP-dependent nuclease n=1 Tax=Cryobacterium sp. TMB1-7 TaxID=2555866 RepID=UPI00141BF53E|nr:AAA family ATPase [Cryobacterium sp. TMB1-7]